MTHRLSPYAACDAQRQAKPVPGPTSKALVSCDKVQALTEPLRQPRRLRPWSAKRCVCSGATSHKMLICSRVQASAHNVQVQAGLHDQAVLIIERLHGQTALIIYRLHGQAGLQSAP